jgi:predicted  nucleic acid-binding Zn-ribbon protein
VIKAEKRISELITFQAKFEARDLEHEREAEKLTQLIAYIATLPTKAEFEEFKIQKEILEDEFNLLQNRLQLIIENGNKYRVKADRLENEKKIIKDELYRAKNEILIMESKFSVARAIAADDEETIRKLQMTHQ